MTNGTSEVTQGGQLALCSGGGDLKGVLTLDRIGLVEGLRDGRSDRPQGIDVKVSGTVGQVHEDADDGVPARPGGLHALEVEAGVGDDGGEQVGEAAGQRVSPLARIVGRHSRSSSRVSPGGWPGRT